MPQLAGVDHWRTVAQKGHPSFRLTAASIHEYPNRDAAGNVIPGNWCSDWAALDRFIAESPGRVVVPLVQLSQRCMLRATMLPEEERFDFYFKGGPVEESSFRAIVKKTAAHCGPAVIAQLTNEPDTWVDSDGGAELSRLARAASETGRASSPYFSLYAPPLGSLGNLPRYRTMLTGPDGKGGRMLDHVDGVSAHQYGLTTAAQWDAAFGPFWDMLRSLGADRLPLMMSEVGNLNAPSPQAWQDWLGVALDACKRWGCTWCTVWTWEILLQQGGCRAWNRWVALNKS